MGRFVDVYSAGEGDRGKWTVTGTIYSGGAGGKGTWAVSVDIYSAVDRDRGK